MTSIQSLGQEDPLEEEMTTHTSILAWEIPWTEELGGLQSMGSQNSQTGLSLHAVLYEDTCTHTHTYIHTYTHAHTHTGQISDLPWVLFPQSCSLIVKRFHQINQSLLMSKLLTRLIDSSC